MPTRRLIHKPILTSVSAIFFAALLNGCSSNPTNPDDPWEGWNRGTHDFNDGVDRYVLKPVAKGYETITPDIVSQGVTNFFSNIDDIGVFINDVFQLKMLQAGKDFSRFLINTSAGVAGFVDVASMVDLPKNNEDFDQTLGYWGVPSGPYLVLPFFGPSSPRGVAGLMGDALMDPLNYAMFAGAAVSAASSAANALDVTDQRAGLLSTEKMVDEASVDRYDFIRSSYLQRRNYLIHDGNVPDEEGDLLNADDLNGEFGEGGDNDSAPHHLELSSPPQE
jgi:phospholipid-binding lipoprotein MlaA